MKTVTEQIEALQVVYNSIMARRNALPFFDEWSRNKLGEQAGVYRRQIDRLKANHG